MTTAPRLTIGTLRRAGLGDATLGQRWRAFVKGKQIANQAEMTFSAVGEQLRAFLGPLAEALAGSVELVGWSRTTGWTARAIG